MSNFDMAITYVLENEGGFTNDANDSGGATNFGITAAEAQRHGFDVNTLTMEQARGIYRSDYWGSKFDAIADQRVATKLLDMSVNFGTRTAAKLAQGALGMVQDGIVGPATVAAMNAKRGDVMLTMLVAAAVIRYAAIVVDNPSQLVFLRGWIARALKVPAV